MAEERWRPVVGFEGLYEISSHHRVKSLERTMLQPSRPGGAGYRVSTRILRPSTRVTHRARYQYVNLYRGGRRFQRYVHCLAAAAFGDT